MELLAYVCCEKSICW